MKILRSSYYDKGDNVARANVVWNIAGSFVYAFASMVLSFLVIRMARERKKGGIFSLWLSLRWASSCFSGLFWESDLPHHRRKRVSIPCKEYREHRT